MKFESQLKVGLQQAQFSRIINVQQGSPGKPVIGRTKYKINMKGHE